MTKWRHETVEQWRERVRIESKRLALLISQGAVDGPDLADRIEQLIVKAAERRPEAVR